MINYELLKKKKMTLSLKISNLSDSKKDFITDCFINLAKFDFRKKFLQWFLDTRVDDDEKAQEVQEAIDQAEQMMARLIEFITEGKEYIKAQPLAKQGTIIDISSNEALLRVAENLKKRQMP